MKNTTSTTTTANIDEIIITLDKALHGELLPLDIRTDVTAREAEHLAKAFLRRRREPRFSVYDQDDSIEAFIDWLAFGLDVDLKDPQLRVRDWDEGEDDECAKVRRKAYHTLLRRRLRQEEASDSPDVTFMSRAMATLPETSPFNLRCLADSEDEEVQRLVAWNPSTPPDVLQELSNSSCGPILEGVYKNPNTPPEVFASWNTTLPRWAWEIMAERPDLDPDMREEVKAELYREMAGIARILAMPFPAAQ